MKLESIIPMFFGGAAAGSLIYFFVSGHGDELFKSFRAGGGHGHHGHGHGDDKHKKHRTHRGHYGRASGDGDGEEEEDQSEDSTFSISFRKSRHEKDGGYLGRKRYYDDNGHEHHGYDGYHHINAGGPIHHHRRFSGEHRFGEEFDPSQFDFERLYDDAYSLASISHDNLSI